MTTTMAPSTPIYRQGDILFTRLESLPDEPLAIRESDHIAEGEVTGHYHRLLNGRILENAQGVLYLEILANTQIVHQEHGPISLPPGNYRITRQREYTPEAIWMVFD